jgi:hypothetical protein
MAEGEEAAIITLDFVTLFPHKSWISNWSKDEHYPEGFRYKLMSVRNEASGQFEFVVVIEEPGERKTEMTRLTVAPESALERTARTFVKGLADDYHLEFEEQDFSGIRSEKEFERRSAAIGWGIREPQD